MTVLLAQLDRDETVAQSLAQEREPLRRHQRVAVEAQPEDPQAMGAAPGQRRPGPDRRNRSCACATGSPEWATTAGTAPVRPPPGRPPWPGRSRRRNRHGHRRRAGSPPAWTIRAQPFAASFFTPDTSAPVSSTTPRNSCPISTRWRSHSRAWATASPGSPSSRPNGSTLLGVVVALTRAKSRAPSWNEASTTEAAPDADSSLTDVRRQRDNLVVLAVDMDPVPDLQRRTPTRSPRRPDSHRGAVVQRSGQVDGEDLGPPQVEQHWQDRDRVADLLRAVHQRPGNGEGLPKRRGDLRLGVPRMAVAGQPAHVRGQHRIRGADRPVVPADLAAGLAGGFERSGIPRLDPGSAVGSRRPPRCRPPGGRSSPARGTAACRRAARTARTAARRSRRRRGRGPAASDQMVAFEPGLVADLPPGRGRPPQPGEVALPLERWERPHLSLRLEPHR